MATVTTTTPHQISVYGHPSPATSATTTPTNNSPTSPRQQYLPLHNRQLRPPKGPLYVPAALRPTEHLPKKASPPTPPRSLNGSLDGCQDDDHHPISRRSTMESTSSSNQGISKLAEDEWMKHEHLGEVTGHPTRDHWKADSASPNCDSPTCRSSFGLFLRRHHCRHCGHVFCASHTLYAVPLDQNARFHPDGVPSRACDLCWVAFQRWEESRTARLSKIQNLIDDSDNSLADPDSAETEPSPVEGPKAKLAAALQGQNHGGGEIAASVPRGWNWSTF